MRHSIDDQAYEDTRDEETCSMADTKKEKVILHKHIQFRIGRRARLDIEEKYGTHDYQDEWYCFANNGQELNPLKAPLHQWPNKLHNQPQSQLLITWETVIMIPSDPSPKVKNEANKRPNRYQ
jgi:hypothetical protein